MDFSIILIVNNLKMFEGFRINLHKQEGVQYEVFPVMNLNGEFSSARVAYNSVLNKCTGKYILFTHPDIRFRNSQVLSSINDQLCSLKRFGVAGAAGAAPRGEHDRDIYSCMVHGDKKKSAGINIDTIKEVQTLDECFFIVDQKYMKTHIFPEVDGWHLYAVELCLDCIINGEKNYVIPISIWHISDGKSLDVQYVYQLERIINKYYNYFPVIYTTVKAWKTKGLLPKVYRKYYIVKQKIKRKLLRS